MWFKLTIQTNLKIVNFLDAEMNLDTGTYRFNVIKLKAKDLLVN